MKLNNLEFALMNNPARAWCQRRLETPLLIGPRGALGGLRVLEVGCGRGVGIEIVIEQLKAAEVVAFDIDPEMVALAKQRTASFGDQVHVFVGDAEHIDAPDASFDAVIDYGILHHVPDWQQALREIARVLKAGGTFYFEDILKGFTGAPVMLRLFDHPQVTQFTGKEFRDALTHAGLQLEDSWRQLGEVGLVGRARRPGHDGADRLVILGSRTDQAQPRSHGRHDATILSSHTLLRLAGGVLLFDGLATLTFCNRYVRQWRIGAPSGRYNGAINWLARRPRWLLQAAGALEAGLGIAALGKASWSYDAFYRTIAGSYDRLLEVWYDRLYPDADKVLRRTLDAHLPAEGHVLDLGCGTGANLERLLTLDIPFASYTGVDQSEAMLRQARCKFTAQETVTFRQRDLATDSLPAGPFDLIISTWVFEHLEHPEHVVRKAWEVLRPGGHIVLLYEVKDETWSSRLVGWLWMLLDARLLGEDEVEGFPGVATIRQIRGLGAPVVLVVLEKPALTGQA